MSKFLTDFTDTQCEPMSNTADVDKMFPFFPQIYKHPSGNWRRPNSSPSNCLRPPRVNGLSLRWILAVTFTELPLHTRKRNRHCMLNDIQWFLFCRHNFHNTCAIRLTERESSLWLESVRTLPEVLFLFGLWGYWHCGHSWPIVPASSDSEDDCGEADGM
jgi:hypothetical protein